MNLILIIFIYEYNLNLNLITIYKIQGVYLEGELKMEKH